MPDFTPLLKVVKQSAQEAENANRPVQVCFGKVVSAAPLKIQIDQKITLGMAQLVLTRTVHGLLLQGDDVVLLRQQGGQKYIVIDRTVTT